MTQEMSLEQLSAIMLDSAVSANDKGWHLYRFLHAKTGPALASDTARSLLAQYMQLPLPRPSLLHSLILGAALKMADAYPDFKLTGFVDMWDVANLRAEDLQRQTTPDGKSFGSLAERTARSLLRYCVKNPGQIPGAAALDMMREHGAKAGFLPIRRMVAVKMFESQKERRKVRMVKLVGADGSELSADWHLFGCKPWEICGRMYDVLPRVSATSGNQRVDTLHLSQADVAEIFGRRIGYVDSYDPKNRHYHIYDNESRHFVAENPSVRPQTGRFVWFAPVVPAQDPFKTAVVLANETDETGSETFGITQARVLYTNSVKGYLAWETTDGAKGYARFDQIPTRVSPDDVLRMITYMRRGKDGEKRLHAGRIL